jgi:hypothetical protein
LPIAAGRRRRRGDRFGRMPGRPGIRLFRLTALVATG